MIGDDIMEKYSIAGHSKLIDKGDNLWGFVVEDNDNNETLLSDDYFSSSIVIALDEIATFLGKPDIKEGQRVRITIETEQPLNIGFIWKIRGDIMIIDKTKYNNVTGFELGVLYCFNNNLKGEYCNHCKSKSDCRSLTIEEQRKYFEKTSRRVCRENQKI